jgi:hypothetical protein
MIVTILGSLFLLALVGVIFYGYGFIMKTAKGKGLDDTEQCFLCKTSYDKKELVERAVGDSRLVYFCRSCIRKLSDESAAR